MSISEPGMKALIGFDVYAMQSFAVNKFSVSYFSVDEKSAKKKGFRSERYSLDIFTALNTQSVSSLLDVSIQFENIPLLTL